MSASNDDIRVRIAGDLSDIRKAIQDLRKETKAAGETAAGASTAGFGVLGKGLTNLRGQVSGLVGAYLSFRGVQSVFSGVIRATVEAEERTAALEARIKSTGGVAGFTGEQLVGLAKDLQDVTRFSDEAIVGAQQVLLGFQNIRGDTFTDTTLAVLDMATALRTDASTAAQQLGKALNDPVRGITQLRRQGILLSAEQATQIKHFTELNDLASAQGVILGALEKQFGGAADAARNTLGGALDGLKNAFGELLEGKGAGAEGVRDAIESLTKVLQDPATVAAFQTLVTAVLSAAEQLAKAARFIITATQDLSEFVASVATGIEDPSDQVEALNKAIQRNAEDLAFAEDAARRYGDAMSDASKVTLDRLRNEARSLAEARAVLDKNPQAFFAGGVIPGRPPAAGTAGVNRPTPAAGATAAVVAPDLRPALKELEAALEAAGIKLNDQLKRLRTQLDADFEHNLVSFRDYYAKRTELETRALNQRIETQQTTLKLLEEEIRLGQERGDEVEEQEAKRAKLIAEITVLEQERGDVAAAAARQQADAEQKLADQLTGVRERLQELQGNDVGARSTQLEREFRDLLARLQAEGDAAGEQLVKDLIDVELARSRLDQIDTDYQATLANLERAQRRIEVQVETGAISEREGRRRIIELHTETAAKLEELIPLMEQLSAATGDPAAIARVEDLKLEIEELAATAKTAMKEAQEAFRDAGESALSSFLSNTKSASDAWDGFLDDLRKKAADFVSEKVFDKLFGFLGGLGGGGAGGAGIAGGGFLGFLAGLFHQGGVVGEAGPSRRVPRVLFAGAPRLHNGLAADEFPAILQKGEGVVSRRDMQRQRAGGGGDVNVTIVTKDAESFRRESEGQIGASIATQIGRARNRNGG